MLGRLNRYLNQKATWGRQTGINEYGKSERTTTMIDCKIEKSIRLTQDVGGRNVTSSMTIYIGPQDGVSGCEDFMGDTLNGMPIIAVKEMIDAKGSIVGYEVML